MNFYLLENAVATVAPTSDIALSTEEIAKATNELADKATSAIAGINLDTIAGKLNMGTQVLILGMLMVFSVLGIIFLALTVFKLFTGGLSSHSDNRKKEAAPVAEPTAPAAANDGEIVAVIAAAIAAAESETPEAKFRVVSFRRIS